MVVTDGPETLLYPIASIFLSCARFSSCQAVLGPGRMALRAMSASDRHLTTGEMAFMAEPSWPARDTAWRRFAASIPDRSRELLVVN